MQYLGQEMINVDFDDDKIRVGLIRSSVHSPTVLAKMSYQKRYVPSKWVLDFGKYR